MKKNYNENLVAGAAIRDDKGRRISKLFEASHPRMTVGYARNLIMPSDPEEQEFNFRQSGGGVIEDGVAVIDKVKGNSVMWNQLVKPTQVVGVSGVTMTLNVDGSITLNGTATETKAATIFFKEISLIKGQKVVLYRDNLVGKNAIQVPSNKTGDFAVNVQQEGRTFTIKGTGGESMVWIKINNGDTFSNTKIHIGLSNLTQMFGAGNEPSTYEEFLSRKPKVADEYAYNEGEIINNKVEGIKTTDANGNETGRLDLSWVKEIKDVEGVKLFEDGLKSAGSAYDEVGAKGATKRMGVKVFDGTERFMRYQYSNSFWYFRLDASTMGVKIRAQYLCNKYVYKGADTSLLNEDKTIALYHGPALILIRDDSFENADSFKQHLAELYAQGNPLVVVYELAEPIEIEYDEKNLSYPVVAGGTEEAIASEPSSAFCADIGYGIDAVKTILDLRERVKALEGK